MFYEYVCRLVCCLLIKRESVSVLVVEALFLAPRCAALDLNYLHCSPDCAESGHDRFTHDNIYFLRDFLKKESYSYFPAFIIYLTACGDTIASPC